MPTKKATAKKSSKKAPSVKLWKREPGWDKLAPGEESKLQKYCEEYRQFISENKTERRAFAAILKLAQDNGFQDITKLNDQGKRLKPGDGIYRTVDNKTILLARIGKAPIEQGLNLVGGHIDCPRLDLKPYPLYQ